MSYQIVQPDAIYRGKSYSQWIEDFSNWFFSPSPDTSNTGPVKFLRSYPSPQKIASLNPSSQVQYEASAMYKNYPNVMVGRDKLEIYDDEAILFPAMLAIYFATVPSDDPESMRAWIRNANNMSDDPPSRDQILIDEEPIKLTDEQIRTFRIETSLFTVRIPDVQYPDSLKFFVQNADELDNAGDYTAVTEGYFFLLKFNAVRQTETHYIFSHAKGVPYNVGDYYATFVYQIDVIPNSFRSKPPLNREGVPALIKGYIEDELNKKVEGGEINKDIEHVKIMEMVDKVRGSQTAIAKNEAAAKFKAASEHEEPKIGI
jgi:hypothetical protein